MTRKEKKIQSITRARVLAAILLVVMTVYIIRMFSVQIINADDYIAQGNAVSEYRIDVKAARGEILDRYGRPIAINRQGFNIVLNKAFLPEAETNEIILKLTQLLTSNSEKWIDELPLTPAGDAFLNEAENTYEIEQLKKNIGVAEYATATDCYNTMVKKFGIDHYNTADARTIMGVRYTMILHDFSYATPYTFAEDVSNKTATIIQERHGSLPGVEISSVPYREYVDPSFAPHVIGTIGPIYAEQWEGGLKDSNEYSLDDKIGKSGLELALEKDLKGTNGVDEVKIDVDGNKVYTHESLPINGNTVVLTLDRDLQKVAQASLEKTIKELNKTIPTCKTGAVVVTEVNSGEILACATYPTYTSVEYESDYDKLLANPDKPLFNRALNGTYPPGSTYKPMVAASALEAGVIDKNATIYCPGYYVVPNAFGGPDMTFTCTDSHGTVNVHEAIEKSCNVFFYKFGQETGIDTLNKYATQFGLGQPPGDELNSEKGLLASPQYREENGLTWNAGDEVQASIGQSDNAFTPLQLAVYTSAIANDGIRYQPHFVKSVKSYSLENDVREVTPTVLNEIDISDENFDIVQNGMRASALSGTASPYFANYDIPVATKTGTAQTLNGVNNSIFISYAPFDKPEIAVSVVIEHGDFGVNAAPVVLDIYDQYFFANETQSSSGENGVLLP